MSGERAYTVDDVEFWERLYTANSMPWDIGQPAPPLATFLNSPYAVPPGSIAVLGCGSGHDCLLFASRGFQVTGIDFAPTAIQLTYEKFVQAGIAGTQGFLLERNIFDIHEYTGYFDYVLEHSFFNSLHPTRRRSYGEAVAHMLKPGGKLIALFWVHDRPDGPPYGVPKDEIFGHFKDLFTFDIVFVPTNSVPQRQGQELFCLMTKK